MVANKETRMEVDAEKSKDIFGSQEQSAGKYHKAKAVNKSLENVKQIGYLETTLINLNYNSEVSKRSLDSIGA